MRNDSVSKKWAGNNKKEIMQTCDTKLKLRSVADDYIC